MHTYIELKVWPHYCICLSSGSCLKLLLPCFLFIMKNMAISLNLEHESLVLVFKSFLNVICNLKFMKCVPLAPYDSSFVPSYLQNLKKQHQSQSSSLRRHVTETKKATNQEPRLLSTSGLESRTPLDIPTSILHMPQPYSLTRESPYSIIELYASCDFDILQVFGGVFHKCTS